MKIWLDDERPMPKGFDKHCLTAEHAMVVINNNKDEIDFISFDHDLGENRWTGYHLAKFIEGLAYSGEIKRVGWAIHSANPVGRKNIADAMNNADKFWGQNE
jgi:hypothetical protein